MAAHDSRTRAGKGTLAPRLAIIGATVAVVAGFMIARLPPSTEQVVDTVLSERFVAGRLSGQTAWRPCEVEDTTLVPRMICDAPPVPSDLKVPPADSSPAALRARALLELRVGADVAERRQRAIDDLEIAVEAAPHDAGLHSELAAAYLTEAEREQRWEPMAHALDNIERAYAADSTQLSILFTRALILQRAYLVHSAELAWKQYLASERDPRWRAEAEQHLAEVRGIPDTISWTTHLTGRTPPRLDEMSRLAVRFKAEVSPQVAREFCFTLLQEWGKAQILGSSLRAERLLALAREIGDALEADSSVAYAVQAIDEADDDTLRLHELAHGHVELAEAFHFTEKGDYENAQEASDEAERRLSAGRSGAARWAAFYYASSEVNLGNRVRGRQLLQSLRTKIGSGEPVLLGKTIWGLGLIELREGAYGDADSIYHVAAPYIQLAGERENNGTVATLISEASIMGGRQFPADTLAYRALRLLAPYRHSKYLAYHLNIVAANARASRLSFAARALTTEGLAVAQTRARAGVLRMPSQLALLYSARARDNAAVGNWAAADRDLASVREWTARIPKSGARGRANVMLATGQVTRLQSAAAALPYLREAIATYRSASNDDLSLPTALAEAALAALETDRISEARAFLRQAMEHVERQQLTFTNLSEQTAFYDTVENLFDAMVALELRDGHPDSAFAALERGRISWASQPGSSRATPARIRAALEDSTLLVEYALLADRLVIWTFSRSEVRHHVVLVSRSQIKRLTERLGHYETMGELRMRGSASEQLFNLLILPLTPELSRFKQLTIVPDRELYAVPFAALRDPVKHRFLVESHALNSAPSAAFYLNARSRPIRWPEQWEALVVGNPELDSTLQVGLPSLGRAEEEARKISDEYTGADSLIGPAARRGLVLQRLDSATVFHFAGHAVFNPDRPEESYLALGADTSGNRGMLRAWEIGNLRLSNLQVVVLSACSTLGQRATRTGPAAGLAYSFLRARVPATVSTLWDVPDSAPTELLVTFHRRLRSGDLPAEALRTAQREAIARGDSPRAWAAFVYTGP